MGQTHATGGPKSPGRLTMDEAYELLSQFHLPCKPVKGRSPVHKQPSMKGRRVSSISVGVLLGRFPPVLQPMISAFLPELKPATITSGKISADQLIEMASICLYPRPREIETVILRGLIRQSGQSANTERHVVWQFFMFVYLLMMYTQHPESALFGNRVFSSEQRSLSNLPRSSQGMEHPAQFRNSCSGAVSLSKRDSWDLHCLFASKNVPNLDWPDPTQISFMSLQKAFDQYRCKYRGELLGTIFPQWIEETLNCVSFVIAAGFKEILLPTVATRTRQVMNSTSTATTSDDQLPEHSQSMMDLHMKSGGWKGLYLASSSKCFDDELCFSLRLVTPEFRTNRWVKLYATWQHGRSFNRCAACILGYPATSILVVKAEDGSVFGACVVSPWEESNGKYFGSARTFLWTYSPYFSVVQSSGAGTNLTYLNSKNAFHPKGIGFGGQKGCFRLWLSDEFSECYTTKSDSTYVSGDLCPSREGDDAFQVNFSVQEVEIWGTGGGEALRRQAETRQVDEAIRVERRQVDRNKLAANEFDREFLLGSTFAATRIRQ